MTHVRYAKADKPTNDMLTSWHFDKIVRTNDWGPLLPQVRNYDSTHSLAHKGKSLHVYLNKWNNLSAPSILELCSIGWCFFKL